MSEPSLIFVTSEDDQYLVKGGIGTAIGVLSSAVEELYPNRQVDWITESPSCESFQERDRHVTRHYLSRYDSRDRMRLTLSRFARLVDRYLQQLTDAKRLASPDSGIIIEAADWEGLAAEFFSVNNFSDVLRVSRLHTPLVISAFLNKLEPSVEDDRQMRREHLQLRYSDLLSSPTKYILESTLKEVLGESGDSFPPSVVIPNCANIAEFTGDSNDPGRELDLLRQATGLTLPEASFKIFVLGSLEVRKGTLIIQEAIPKLFDAIPDSHLVWIGHYAESGELTANTKLDADAFYSGIPNRCHRRVHLAGYVDHKMLPSVLRAADMFAVCYLGDNFPGAVLEIALAERPMAVLLRGGIPEMIIAEDRPLSFMLDDDCPLSIADQLVHAAMEIRQNPIGAKEQAVALRRHVINRFSPEAVATRLIGHYDFRLEEKRLKAEPRCPAR